MSVLCEAAFVEVRPLDGRSHEHEEAAHQAVLATRRSGTIALVTIDRVVPDHHVIADLHLRRVALGDRGVLPVLQLHHHLPTVVAIAAAFADRVAGEAATHRSGNRGCSLALAAAHLVADQAADDGANHGTNCRAIAVAELYLADVADVTAALVTLPSTTAVTVATRRPAVIRAGAVGGPAGCKQQRGGDDADQQGQRMHGFSGFQGYSF